MQRKTSNNVRSRKESTVVKDHGLWTMHINNYSIVSRQDTNEASAAGLALFLQSARHDDDDACTDALRKARTKPFTELRGLPSD